MSSQKEPFFFDTDEKVIGRPTPREYQDMFSGVHDNHFAIGEASTTYLYSRRAVSNILSYVGKVPRFIVCVRNPIEMALSLHNHLLFHGVETVNDFEKAWRSHGTQAGGSQRLIFGSHPSQIHYGLQCKLGEQLERLYGSVPERMVLVLVLDDVVREPKAEYDKVLGFLGLPADDQHAFPIYNEGKGTKSITVARIMNFIALAKQTLHIRKGLGIHRYIRDQNAGVKTKPKISLEFLTELSDYFHLDVEKLGSLVGRDFTEWISPQKYRSLVTTHVPREGMEYSESGSR
jgi:hypothetical protein